MADRNQTLRRRVLYWIAKEPEGENLRQIWHYTRLGCPCSKTEVQQVINDYMRAGVVEFKPVGRRECYRIK